MKICGGRIGTRGAPSGGVRPALLVISACATQPPAPEQPQPLDVVWADSIGDGDLIVAVPGTGGYTTLVQYIDASATVDWRTNNALNPIVRDVGAAKMYEVDRPDDPVHALDFARDIERHQYVS